MPDGDRRVARFGPFAADATSNELRKRGVRVELQDLPTRILFRLLQDPGHLVTRTELQQTLWPDDTFVDFERGLNTAMSKLRSALDDSAASPRYIETIPKRGYRFIGEIQPASVEKAPERTASPAKVVPLIRPANAGGISALQAEVPQPIGEPESVPAPFVVPLRGRRRWKSWHWRSAAGALLLLAAVLGWLAGRERLAGILQPRPKLKVEALTTYQYDEYAAGFSPDGGQVVFSWDREDRGPKLYVKQTDSGPARQLTFGPGRDEFAAWSPDGQHIAFVRALQDVLLVSPQGGPERNIGETVAYHLAWTPDSQEVILSHPRPGTRDFDLDAVSIATGARRRLTSPGDVLDGYRHFGLSPDGRFLAYTGHASAKAGGHELFVRELTGGPARQLTFMGAEFFGFTWTPDSREIICSSNRDGFPSLWRIRVDGDRQTPQPILLPGEQNTYPFMAPFRVDPSGGQPALLGYESVRRTMNLHQQRLGAVEAASTLVAPSTHDDECPQYSPDGKSIVFVSNRTGFSEIWLASSSSDEPIALTSFAKANLLFTGPRWSPDGRRIVFSVLEGNTSDIYSLTIEGGLLRRLTHSPTVQDRPSWSHDGKWVYFGSNWGGHWQVWRIPGDVADAVRVQGRLEQAEPLTQAGGCEAIESPDGAYLYFNRDFAGTDLWRMPMVDGKPDESKAAVVIRELLTQGWWGLAAKGVFLADVRSMKLVAHPAAEPKPVYFFDPATRRMTRVGTIRGRGWSFRPGFCVSPDGSKIIYVQLDVENIDLMMVRNFR